jgi:hypothetical protein
MSQSRAWRRLCETFRGESAPNQSSATWPPRLIRAQARQMTPRPPAHCVAGSMLFLIDGRPHLCSRDWRGISSQAISSLYRSEFKLQLGLFLPDQKNKLKLEL